VNSQEVRILEVLVEKFETLEERVTELEKK
jgi:hypothetical protein